MFAVKDARKTYPTGLGAVAGATCSIHFGSHVFQGLRQ
jgi:high-affinity Fe2+/Pb2+ permease